MCYGYTQFNESNKTYKYSKKNWDKSYFSHRFIKSEQNKCFEIRLNYLKSQSILICLYDYNIDFFLFQLINYMKNWNNTKTINITILFMINCVLFCKSKCGLGASTASYYFVNKRQVPKNCWKNGNLQPIHSFLFIPVLICLRSLKYDW